MSGLNSVKRELVKSESNYGARRLCCVAVAPLRGGNPIAQLAARMFSRDVEPDSPDEYRWSRTQRDRQRQTGPARPRLGVRFDPLRTTALGIRMWDIERGVGNLPRACQALDVGPVGGREWPKR